MTEKYPQTQLLNHDPQDPLEWITCQLANLVGIAAGIGVLPLLSDYLPIPFWKAEMLVGVLCILVGLIFLERRTPRLLPFLKRMFGFLRRLPSIFKRLIAFLRGLPALLRRAWDWIRRHLPGRRKGSPEQVSPETPAVKESPPEAAPSTASDTIPQVHQLVLLPYMTLLIGLLILLPAILVDWLHPLEVLDQNLDLVYIAVYFSAPALLIWVVAEIPYILPKIVVKPWDGSVVTGLLKSGLQALGAVLVWVYLALSLGKEEHTWLLFGGLGLALMGLIFGFISEAIERQRIRTRPQNPRPAQMRETAG